MFITPKHDTHPHRPEPVHPRPHAHVSRVRRCGFVLSGDPAVRWLTCNHMHELVGFCLCMTLADCLTKVCTSKRGSWLVLKVEEPEEEEENRSEEGEDQILGTSGHFLHFSRHPENGPPPTAPHKVPHSTNILCQPCELGLAAQHCEAAVLVARLCEATVLVARPCEAAVLVDPPVLTLKRRRSRSSYA